MKHLLCFGTVLALIHTGHLIQDYCNLPMNEGEGMAFTFALYFDPATDSCLPFLYKGEGGNANRFSSEKECIRNCSTNADNIYPVDVIKACRLPKALGTCGGNLLKYYYDSVYDKCKKFIYSGCLGNANRFDSQESCNATCAGVHDDRVEEEDIESDTPIAIICGVLLAVVVCAIIITVVVLTVKSKKKDVKKKGPGKTKDQPSAIPLQETAVEMS